VEISASVPFIFCHLRKSWHGCRRLSQGDKNSEYTLNVAKLLLVIDEFEVISLRCAVNQCRILALMMLLFGRATDAA
jgi:hypothetical protein